MDRLTLPDKDWISFSARIAAYRKRVADAEAARAIAAPWAKWVMARMLEELPGAATTEAAMVKVGTMLSEKARAEALATFHRYRETI